MPVLLMLLYQRLVLKKDIAAEPLFYPSHPPLRRQGGLLFGIGMALMAITTINAAFFRSGTYFSKHRVPLFGVQTMGAYNYYVNDLFSYLTRGPYVIDESEQALIEQYVSGELRNPCYDAACLVTDQTSPFYGRLEGKDLILFQLESLNTFVIGLEVNGQSVMPFLTALTQQDDVLFYQNFFSSIGIGKTTDAEFANLTGMYPTGFTVTYFDHITEGFETIPSLFGQVGYRTMAVHGSPISFYDRQNIHPLLGFQDSFGTEAIDPSGQNQVNGWTDDATVFAYARHQIQQSKAAEEAFFMMLLSTVSHLPYFEHPDYTTKIDWGLKESMATRALDYFRTLDDDLRVFFEGLETDGSLNNIAFVMYGDHSSGLLRDDLNDILPISDKQTFQRMLQNVPLILYTPGLVLEDVDTSLVRSQVDVKRTVAALYALPIERFTGVNILSDRPTLAYNPQNLDIAGDGFFLSATAKIWTPTTALTKEQALLLIEEFYAMKRMNDWILKTEAFRPGGSS
jgi:phosphoglycerol transferase MdoB-like AlkP superfamily enzyme